MTSKQLPTSTDLEALICEDGARAYRELRRRQTELGNETLLAPVGRLLRVSTTALAEAVGEWLLWIEGRKRQPHAAYPFIRECGPELAAHYACQTVLDQLSRERHYANVAREIGRRVEDELRIRCIRENDYAAWKRLCLFGGRGRKGSALDVRRAGRATVKVRGIPWGGWSHEKRIQVGVVLLDLLIRSTGLVAKEMRDQHIPGRHTCRQHLILVPHPQTIEWLELAHTRTERLTLRHRPIERAPEPWGAELEGGGYHLEGLSYRLVKEPRGGFERRAPVVAAAANALQSTAWRINRRVLAVLQRAWERQVELPDIPPAGKLPCPPWPGLEDEEKEREWRRLAASLHRGDESRMAQRIRAARLIEQASQMETIERLYFPQRADFRGRLYPRAGSLGWTGGDLARGVLEFADAVEWTEGGVAETQWLACHLAARWGLSRASYEVRVRWVKARRQEIIAAATAPLERRGFWSGAKDPWEFLAACFAWADMELGRGDGHLRLPVSVDASANGLQIDSLLIRDEVLAQRVNVIPSDVPSDVYGLIASRATEVLAGEDGEEEAPWARTWLDMLGGTVTRELAKLGAMTLIYGAGRKAVRDDLVRWYERLVRRDWGGRYCWPCWYLADVLYRSTRELTGRAFWLVEWFREAARRLARQGIPLRWTTPSGFFIVTDRRRQRSRMIQTATEGTVRVTRATEDTEELSPKDQAKAAAPNFVQSLDAAVLHLTVAGLAERGVRSIGTAHDAYAVHCAHVGRLHGELRRVVCAMFERDLLAEFAAGLTDDPSLLPSLPDYGELDPSVVASSPYLFS